MKKNMALFVGITMLMPQFSLAFGDAATIEKFVNRQVTVPLIKPSWGNFLLHTEKLNKLYSLRGYQALWVDGAGLPNDMSISLKKALMEANHQGLNAEDYWDQNVEKLYQAAISNQNNWITFELAASEALIRYATHLSVGRFDPVQVDTDIKYKKKIFDDYQGLQRVLSEGSTGLNRGLDQMAPKHPRYIDLVDILDQLVAIKNSGGWEVIPSPGISLKLGSTHPVLKQIEDRFNQLGYKISGAGAGAGGSKFDAEFELALKTYQSMNGLTADGVIGKKSEVIKSLNHSLDQRILQVKLNMEKLRWMPKDLEARHIFVNLATTEFKLQDSGVEVFNFKTINGDPFHRTPIMKDKITFVNLNPTWTVPSRLAIKEMLPKLRSIPDYLKKNDMNIYDQNTNEKVDSSQLNFKEMTAQQFPYYIRQDAGLNNALGVVKFPLHNPWAIYLHDTNQRTLFEESERHLSHGCIRLEKPLDLASYLLQDQQGWSLPAITAFVPSKKGEQPLEQEKKVNLTRGMPVYTMYLTAEKSKNGAIRFVEDVYGQDYRLAKALVQKKSEIQGNTLVGDANSGNLRVEGVAGKSQIFHNVKAVRCDIARRGHCDPAVVFQLNTSQNLPAGDYIVGFENSINPETVKISSGQTTVLKLQQVAVPASIHGQKIRVYRDFNEAVEKDKILLEIYFMGHHFQALDKDNFGDLYEGGSWERDFVQRFGYEVCSKIKLMNAAAPVAPEALENCKIWSEARQAQDLSPLFQFGTDGTFQEFWVTYPGDVIPLKHPRYLVSAPMSEHDFISVFPGAYRFQSEGSKTSSISVKVGPVD
jgi:murein L,D-transpeptidase YcbB/YkuD